MSYALEITVVASAYVIISIIGAYLIKLMLRGYGRKVELGGLKNAGMVIGIVERIIVLTFGNNDRFCSQIYCKIQ